MNKIEFRKVLWEKHDCIAKVTGVLPRRYGLGQVPQSQGKLQRRLKERLNKNSTKVTDAMRLVIVDAKTENLISAVEDLAIINGLEKA